MQREIRLPPEWILLLKELVRVRNALAHLEPLSAAELLRTRILGEAVMPRPAVVHIVQHDGQDDGTAHDPAAAGRSS